MIVLSGCYVSLLSIAISPLRYRVSGGGGVVRVEFEISRSFP